MLFFTLKSLKSLRSTSRILKTLIIGIVPLTGILLLDDSRSFAQDPNTKTFGGVTSAIFSCIQGKPDPYGAKTNYEAHDGNQGTATSSLPWPLGNVAVIDYYLDENNQQITYTIRELNPMASANQVWDGIQSKINDCQR
jgi:hypothetical protein